MVKKFHILITEDDSMTRTLLSNYLTEKGYEVFSSENGLEGLRILDQNTIDLVISDYSMPKMGGKELILNIKKIHPRLPVILASGFGRNENKGLQTIKGDLYEYFEKPVKLGLLHSTVKKVQRETLYV